jgi:hypothetical protein
MEAMRPNADIAIAKNIQQQTMQLLDNWGTYSSLLSLGFFD